MMFLEESVGVMSVDTFNCKHFLVVKFIIVSVSFHTAKLTQKT